jgi:O-antigen/teichoic acid export membrane protein
MVVSIVTVPIYLHLVGPTRYGVLSIVWLFLGYFGLFDPGLSRAATYHIARLHDAPAKERGDVFWTALVVNAGFGIVGGLVLYVVSRPLFMSAFKMPEAMRGEVLACLPWLAASVPISIVSGVLGSVLQAREWFGVSNGISILNGLLSQVAPIIVALLYGPNLAILIPAILAVRALGAIPQFFAVIRALPLGAGGRFERSILRELFAYGGWITISNLLAPILISADRMVVGSLLGVNDVSYYSVPFYLVSRISVLPGAFATSVFPKFSRSSAVSGEEMSADAVIWLTAIMTPLLVGATLCLPIFMKLWLGDSFAKQAIPVGSILLFGMWLNAVACVPYNYLQAKNRPDLTAKFHLLELIPFVVILCIGIRWFGLAGAAWSWDLRMVIDVLLLFWATKQFHLLKSLVPGAIFVMAGPLVAPTSIFSLSTCYAIVVIMVSLLWGWHVSPQIRKVMNFRNLKTVIYQT